MSFKISGRELNERTFHRWSCYGISYHLKNRSSLKSTNYPSLKECTTVKVSALKFSLCPDIKSIKDTDLY